MRELSRQSPGEQARLNLEDPPVAHGVPEDGMPDFRAEAAFISLQDLLSPFWGQGNRADAPNEVRLLDLASVDQSKNYRIQYSANSPRWLMSST
jgi:hypothetical protein